MDVKNLGLKGLVDRIAELEAEVERLHEVCHAALEWHAQWPDPLGDTDFQQLTSQQLYQQLETELQEGGLQP